MKRIVFITPRDARYGFSISGVSQLAVTPDEAEATIRKVLAEPDTGVAVVDERLLGGIGEERFRELAKKWYGMLLVLPAPGKGEAAEDYAERLIRRAIGYHVRLNV